MTESAPRQISLSVPAQGIDLRLTPTEAIKFFDEEIAFYRRLQSTTDTTFTFGSQNYGEARLSTAAVEALSALKQGISNSKDEQLADYARNAQAMRHLIGQGTIGKKITEMLSAGQAIEAKWILYLTSPVWLHLNQDRAADIVTAFRAAMMANPAVTALSDLTGTKQALNASTDALRRSSETATEMEQYRQDKTALFSQLEELYRQKLVLDEPAVLWSQIASSKSKAWRAWLFTFASLVVAPIIVGLVYRSEVIATVTKLTTTANGGVSISGIAAITVPTLFYAWLLKNVSRVFIQNLNLADDAAHRRALALTYLGLAANPKLDVSERDRALVLNALFRPIPAQNSDEGPPAGLLELIRKKD